MSTFEKMKELKEFKHYKIKSHDRATEKSKEMENKLQQAKEKHWINRPEPQK